MLTITLNPELERRLKATALEEGQDPASIAETLLEAALEWRARDRAEAIAGIQRGLEASAAGCVRPADEVFADMRRKLRSE